MADNVLVNFTTGSTIYYFIFSANAEIYNGSYFEVFDPSNWANYAMPMVEETSGSYSASFPSLATAVYYLVAYQQLGGSPASGDNNSRVAFGFMNWDGTEEVGGNTVDTIIEQFVTGVIGDTFTVTTGTN